MPLFVFGPSGGTGGDSGVTDSDVDDFEAEAQGAQTRVLQVEVRGGDFVDAIQFIHLFTSGPQNGTPLSLPQHGGNGGDKHILEVGSLERKEHIVKISGKYGQSFFATDLLVHSVKIETDQGQKLEVGGTGGNADYTYEAPPGFEIMGFYGRSGEFVDAMGVVMRAI
jgi:hypothetical protein